MSNIEYSEPNLDLAVFLRDVSVAYRLPSERIGTIKEYAIRRLQRRIKYTSFLALDTINLSIRQGEIFGIIGRNGAGKSTLLKVVSRVLFPTKGRVWINGNISPMLELGAGFHPELTGIENIYLNGTLLGHSRSEISEKMPEIIKFSEIENFINSPIRTYSSGMVARLGFSIATAWIPDILILDEVLSVGDAAFAQKCELKMRQIRESGCTIILVSHSSELVQSLCERVMLLDHGRITRIGSAQEVTEEYQKLLAGLGEIS